MSRNDVRRWAAAWGPTLIVIIALSALAASRYLDIAQSDAILPALMSTQHLTLFYWGQDRLANVLPVLALPVRDEVWNFRFQSLLVACAFFGLIAGMVAFHLRRTARSLPPLFLAGASLVSGMLVLAPYAELTGYRLVFEQLYSVSVGSFLLAIWLFARGGPIWLAIAVMQVAMLLNPSLLLMLPFAWLLDFRAEGRLRRSAIASAAIVATFAVTNVLSSAFGDDALTGPYSTFRPGMLADGIESASRNVYHSVDRGTAVAIGTGVLIVIGARWRSMPGRLRLTYALVPVFAFGWLALFSTNEWVRRNLYDFRYFYTLYMSAALAIAVAVTEAACAIHARTSLADAPAARRWLVTGWSLGAGAAAAVALTVIANVDVAIMDLTRANADVADQDDVRLVVGSYIVTWPLVVQARADGHDVLGVAVRSEAIQEAIDDTVAAARSSSRSVRVMCADLELEPCLEQLERYTETAWRVERTVRQHPLVFDLLPGRPTRFTSENQR